MQRSRSSSFLYGGNAPYLEEQYEQYLADANSVQPSWRDYFDALRATPAVDGSDRDDVAHSPVVQRFVALARQPLVARHSDGAMLAFARKQVGVQSLVAAYRMVGTRQAKLDPLQWTPIVPLPELTLAHHGLGSEDLATTFSAADSYFSGKDPSLDELAQALSDTYCGTLGAEYMHLGSEPHRQWWQRRLESTRSKPQLPAATKLGILDRLTAAEGLERYLHKRFVGQQRFSLEGGESLVPLLDELLNAGAEHGVRHAVLGMAHRGRLNVLVNVAGKSAAALFDEFDGKSDPTVLSGDVKYHKGYSGVVGTGNGPVQLRVAFNPSHLEFINPVVEGMARATAESEQLPQSAVLPIEIHGDAAVIAQGIVQETLNLTYTRGHGTGGTVHVVVNNQVGFTTSDPRDTRSAYFCTDIAKVIECPVLHVNADDPEAVVHAARLALEYRTEFGCSVVIDLVCFRRYGHQEQDTPAMTQPLMYRAIAAHPGVRAIYAGRLESAGLIGEGRADKLVQAHRARLDAAHDRELQGRSATAAIREAPANLPREVATNWAAYAPPRAELVKSLALKIVQVPQGFALHPLVKKTFDARREMAQGGRPLDWGMSEHLAFATLLAAGLDVRLTGQDSERGTFGHRHAVLHNQDRSFREEGTYLPLQHIGESQGRFCVTNSTLSEAAVLAFEYGYSVARPAALVLWEAQYGDFANGAQVVTDQFISAGFVKWGQRSSVVLLLPHGQDGQGPEHASARLERFLQLCAQENMLVCQPTTPAQFFHLIRAQATLPKCRPLVVMTPKSMLRNPAAVSSLAELSTGSFAPVIGEPAIATVNGFEVERVIVCSGKVYYELLADRQKRGQPTTALVRVEQLYPFPGDEIASELARYPHARVVVWCQEEAHNQGAWGYLESQLRAVAHPVPLQYAGPAPAASTSPGGPALHAAYQQALIRSAFQD